MVSTRHHPRPFPEPTLPSSRSPNHNSTSSISSSPSKDTPPSPTETAASTVKRRSASTRRKPSTTASDSTAVTPSKPSVIRRSKSTSSTSFTYVHAPSSLLLTWVFISIPLVTWDTLYVLFRPHTMPGGKFHSPFWTPYALYGTVDYVYGWPAWNDNNGFTAAQGSLNLVELLMYGFYLFVVAREIEGGWNRGMIQKMWRKDETLEVSGRLVIEAVLICYSASVMTLSKTVLYWLNEAFSGFSNIGHNSLNSLIWLWIIPNGAWIVFSTYMIYELGKEILIIMRASSTKRR